MKKQQGLSLIEVVIAMALFTAAIVVLSQSYVGAMLCLEAVKADDPRLADMRFIEDTLYDVTAREEIKPSGDIQTLGSGRVRFSTDVEETEFDDVLKVTLVLEFLEKRDDPKQAHWEEVRYLYRPEWTDADQRKAALEKKREAWEALCASRTRT